MTRLTALTPAELREEIDRLAEIERSGRGISVSEPTGRSAIQAAAERAELEAELRVAGGALS